MNQTLALCGLFAFAVAVVAYTWWAYNNYRGYTNPEAYRSGDRLRRSPGLGQRLTRLLRNASGLAAVYSAFMLYFAYFDASYTDQIWVETDAFAAGIFLAAATAVLFTASLISWHLIFTINRNKIVDRSNAWQQKKRAEWPIPEVDPEKELPKTGQPTRTVKQERRHNRSRLDERRHVRQ